MELVLKKSPSPSMPDLEGFIGWKLLFLLNEKPSDLPLLRASKRALVFWASFLKKEKEEKKPSSNRYSIYLVFYPRFLSRGAAGHLCLALSASHPILNFGEAVGFHLFFASYFILHNSYIRILTIHRYKSSWRCS